MKFEKLKKEFIEIYDNLSGDEAVYFEAWYLDIKDETEKSFIKWGDMEAMKQWVDEIKAIANDLEPAQYDSEPYGDTNVLRRV